MTRYLNFRDGGQTDEEGIARPYSKFLDGEVFEGMNVSQQSPLAMGVKIAAGDIMIDSGNGYPYMGWSDADENITLTTADASNPRYDLIVAYVDLAVVSNSNPNNPNALKFIRVTGTPAGSPVEPNSTAIQSAVGGSNPYAILARVTVAAAVTTITNAAILDRRTMISITAQTETTGWNDLDVTPNTVTHNGNHYYDLVFNGTDLTDTVSVGMPLRLTRTIAAPTQSADLESASSQYFVKTSPNGMSFTDDFVVGAWVKLESYTGSNMTIASRYNGTSGWEFYISGSGLVTLIGHNGAAGNYSAIGSYQSVPLNRWTYVTAQLDMSAFTATTTTSYIMFDGVDVPAAVSRAGSNPTSLAQAGNLEIGSANGGSVFFDGKLAQVFVSSAKITQANIRTIMTQGLTSALVTTHSIVSAYSLSGSTADLNTTNNNGLTAQGSAVTTNNDSPFSLGPNLASAYTAGTNDFAEVVSASFSTNTTLRVRASEGSTIPTSGGITSVFYSTQGSPYGWPGMSTCLQEILLMNDVSVAPGGLNTNLPGVSFTLDIPASYKEVRLSLESRHAILNTAAGTGYDLLLYENSDVVTRVSRSIAGSNYATEATVRSKTFKPTAGSTTYSARVYAVSGTFTIQASTIEPVILRLDKVL